MEAICITLETTTNKQEGLWVISVALGTILTGEDMPDPSPSDTLRKSPR